VGKTQLEKSFVSIREKSFFSSFQQTEKKKKNICKTIAQQKSAQLKEGAILLQQVLRVFFFRFLPRQSDDATLNSLFCFFSSLEGVGLRTKVRKKLEKLKSKKGELNPSQTPPGRQDSSEVKLTPIKELKRGERQQHWQLNTEIFFFDNFCPETYRWKEGNDCAHLIWGFISEIYICFRRRYLCLHACGDWKVNTNFGLCRGWKPNDLTFNRLFSTFVRLWCAANQFHLFLCPSVCLWASLRSSLLALPAWRNARVWIVWRRFSRSTSSTISSSGRSRKSTPPKQPWQPPPTLPETDSANCRAARTGKDSSIIPSLEDL